MLSVDVVGSGPLVVLLHGAFSDRRIFGYQVVRLAAEACRSRRPPRVRAVEVGTHHAVA
jgi:hypothetical protein